MNIVEIVRGEDCLQYVNKHIGLATTRSYTDNFITGQDGIYGLSVSNGGEGSNYLYNEGGVYTPTLYKVEHDVTKRICGLVTDNYSDGGKRVILFGNETLNLNRQHLTAIKYQINVSCHMTYDSPIGQPVKQDGKYNIYPEVSQYAPTNSGATCKMYDVILDDYKTFDEMLDFKPDFKPYNISYESGPTVKVFSYQGTNLADFENVPNIFNITTNKNNTLIFGESVITSNILSLYYANNSKDLLFAVSGGIYDYCAYIAHEWGNMCPKTFISLAYLEQYHSQHGFLCATYNGICVPYNLVLTNSEEFAKEYVENGVLPPDAYLYPLDFDNITPYDDVIPTGDEPDNYPDDNNPDDDDRDFEPTPLETPTFTVNQLTNYNWYWLTVPEWSSFINWFWNDIGDFSDFDDIIAKVKGLYNDLASAVIMCRYYPVDVSWIGGTGTQSNIKIGMIEKAGTVDTLANTSLRAQDIGHVHIGAKYKSFMDMSPYSQLSLYLPWHGFIDLDMNLFNGHDVYVKALYDYLSGTIQYYIYYDNELLVNTILCKMAMDIPITLQTKNDRDSAIFNNVSSTIGGLVGAGVGIASGNPIGMVMGVTQGVSSFNGSNASAPMRLMGNVGESGAYIGCQNCFVIVRRPTIQPSDGNSSTMKGLTTWKKNVGMLCGYGYTLSDLSGQGFTVCHSPRINFTNTVPLQTEVDEIYEYLSKGVIL